jgi:apoptosis-inducing factor 2
VELAPDAISEVGNIRVKPTLQLLNDSFSNIYACGDVVGAGTRNPNARQAMRQAMVVADNVVLETRGEEPKHIYKPVWADGVIKLTLGLVCGVSSYFLPAAISHITMIPLIIIYSSKQDKSVTHFGDGRTELLFHMKEKDLALMAAASWKHMGSTPFEDDGTTLAPYLEVKAA